MLEIGTDIKAHLIEEIDNIAFSLINLAEESTDGMKWPYFQKNANGDLEKSYAYNLYSGNAGIILFFIEAYKINNKEEYYNVIEKAKNGMVALCHADKSYNYSFYSGKAGVLYTLLQLYLLKGKDQGILTQMVELLNTDTSTFIHSKYVDDSFFEGRAGLLVVLNYLYSVLKKENISDLIFETTEALITNIKLNADKIFWVQNDNNAYQPINYSNGTSGIVYALMEMRNLLGVEYLPFLLKHVTAYENLFWDKKAANWLSQRKAISSYSEYLLHKDKYQLGGWDFFNQTFDNISLINGAVGIGLSRLRAFEILKEENLLGDIQEISKKLSVESTGLKDCSIATGKSGILLYYLEAFNVLSDNTFKEAAIKEINNIINIKSKFNKYQFENTETAPVGLMDGLAGLGYTFLSIINPSIDSVIVPKPGLIPEQIEDENEYLETADLKEFILAYSLKGLYLFANKIMPDELKLYLESDEFSEDGFLEYLIEKSNHIKYKEQLVDFVLLEKKKIDLRKSVGSAVVNFIENQSNVEQAQKILNMDNDLFLKLKLQLSAKSQIVKTRWNWFLKEENMNMEPGQFTFLLISKSNLIYRKLISDKSELILLDIFSEVQTIGYTIDRYTQIMEPKDTDSKIKEDPLEIIRELIYLGILVG